MTQAQASFEVTTWDEHQFDRKREAAKLTRAKVGKTYHGDIEGLSVTEWLMGYADDGSATFVGIERIDGTVLGHLGTLVLQHVGSYEGGTARATLTVVDGAGSGELAGTTGSGEFSADPAGTVRLDLAIPS